ncbi:MAG: hypothetical protein QNK31_02120 [Porticoccus sp.]|nr:hypothetical protein [Porticoccus sp.]
MTLLKSIQLLFCLLMAVLAGCASTTEKPVNEPIYWPKAPVAPRYMYVTTLRSEKNVRPVTTEELFRNALTGNTERNRVFGKPFDVAAKEGLVVVSDTILRRAFIFNLQRQKMYQFGHLGKKEGVMTKPMGVAIGAGSQIFVADVSAKKVFVYDAFGLFKLSMGGVGEFDRPVDVAVSPDGKQVYVVDAGGIDSVRHRVVVYDDKGVKQGEFGKRGEAAGEFNLPTQVAVAQDGSVYVLDAGNFRVQVFSATGKFLRAWGKVGRGFGDFARPRGLAVGGDGNVYVTDATFRNIQVFNPKGQLLLAIGDESIADQPGQYAMPAGIALDELGYVYIVDQAFAKVDVLKRLSEKEMDSIVERRRSAK